MKRGFTLVEVFIIIVIIGLLTAMAIPAFIKVRQASIEKAERQAAGIPEPSFIATPPVEKKADKIKEQIDPEYELYVLWTKLHGNKLEFYEWKKLKDNGLLNGMRTGF